MPGNNPESVNGAGLGLRRPLLLSYCGDDGHL